MEDSEDSFYNEVGNYFLYNYKLHDVQFIVGEQQEKIKAVKLLLINQSKTWWSMLSEDSPLMEKGDIHLPDIDPEVFTLLLKHSYGLLDNLEDLSDDIVVKLCYCANKYFMTSLMKKIATRLEPKNVEDLFPAVHCLMYYNLKGVEEGVKKMVQTQTTKILDHAEFLECDVDIVTFICKQERLNCEELTLWKSVVKWARYKAQGGERPQLRQQMSEPLQHIRLLTLSEHDLVHHVFPLGILTYDEIINICKGVLSDLSACSVLKGLRYFYKTVIIRHNNLHNIKRSNAYYSTCSFVIGNQSIMIKSIVCRGILSYRTADLLDSNMTNVDLSIKVSRITNIMNASDAGNLKEEPITLEVNNIQHYYGSRVSIPTLIDGKGITLQANSKYEVELSFSNEVPSWYNSDCAQGHEFDHGKYYCSLNYKDGIICGHFHMLEFTYQVCSG